MAFQPYKTTTGKFIASGDNYNVTAEVTTFPIKLYNNRAESNRVDKTGFITHIGDISGVLRAECSIQKPVIIIEQVTLPTFNYVYIPIFDRYYFVLSVTSVSYGMWRIEFNCDVLMSYRLGIVNLYAYVSRQQSVFDPMLIDNELPTAKDVDVEVIEYSNSILKARDADDSSKLTYVLTVLRGDD